MPKVPTLTLSKRHAELTKPSNKRASQPSKLSPEELELRRRLLELNKQRKELIREIKLHKAARKSGDKLPSVSLYALRLEDGFWYVGMSYNVQRRFQKHLKGDGARWTALHKPLEIVEIRKTEVMLQDDAAKLEDDMTLEYALKYGSQYVRGGGYSQVKYVRWPPVILDNERTLL